VPVGWIGWTPLEEDAAALDVLDVPAAAAPPGRCRSNDADSTSFILVAQRE